MVGGECPLEPRSALALHWSFLVVEAVVAENLRLGIIGGLDLCSPMHQAVRLIKIYRGRDIVGDNLVVLPRLGDAVNLDGEQHWDSRPIQFARQHHYGGGSPAVAKQDDPRLRFFLGAQNSVMIDVEQAQNCLVRSPSVAVFKNLDRVAFREALANLLGKFYGSVL